MNGNLWKLLNEIDQNHSTNGWFERQGDYLFWEELLELAEAVKKDRVLYPEGFPEELDLDS